MTLQEAYYEFSVLLNKNSERKNINIDFLNYVVLFNRELRKFVSMQKKQDDGTDNITIAQEFLVRNYKLELIRTDDDVCVYQLPEDFGRIVPGDFYSYVRTPCTNTGIIYNRLSRLGENNSVREAAFLKPSTAWERGFASINNNELHVYTDNFEIKESYFSYYKIPKLLEVDSINQEVEVDLELSSAVIDTINDKVVLEVHREFTNTAEYQFAATR